MSWPAKRAATALVSPRSSAAMTLACRSFEQPNRLARGDCRAAGGDSSLGLPAATAAPRVTASPGPLPAAAAAGLAAGTTAGMAAGFAGRPLTGPPPWCGWMKPACWSMLGSSLVSSEKRCVLKSETPAVNTFVHSTLTIRRRFSSTGAAARAGAGGASGKERCLSHELAIFAAAEGPAAALVCLSTNNSRCSSADGSAKKARREKPPRPGRAPSDLVQWSSTVISSCRLRLLLPVRTYVAPVDALPRAVELYAIMHKIHQDVELMTRRGRRRPCACKRGKRFVRNG